MYQEDRAFEEDTLGDSINVCLHKEAGQPAHGYCLAYPGHP